MNDCGLSSMVCPGNINFSRESSFIMKVVQEPKPAAIVIHSAQRQDRKVREAIFTRCERQVSNGGIFIVEYNLAHHHDEPGILPSLVDLPDTCEASFTNTICDNVIELSFITNSRCFLKAA